jgi:hypothetical protein
MLGFNRWHLSFVLAAILGGAAIVWLALAVLIPAPPKKITIATGQRNQIYQAIGNSYRTILARSGVDVDVRLTNGAVENLALLNDPHSGVTAGIVQGGISDGAQSPDLLSLAAEVAALEADLDGVDRAIHSLAVPMRYSDVYFSVKSHLDLVRTRIGSRRAEMAAR